MGRSGADWETARTKMQRLEAENDRLRHEIERSQVFQLISLRMMSGSN